MAEKEYFYSNCLIQAIKAKLKNPKQVKITYVSPFDNEVFCPHFLWSDGKNDYDFGIEYHLPLYKILFFKGHIRKRNLGFNQKYKNACKNTRSVRKMAKEYIEHKALLNDIDETVIVSGKTGVTNQELRGINKVIGRIQAMPTADVQEVRHGKNVTEMHPVDEFECSECGFICEISEKIYDDEYTFDCYREYNPKFCPNCGAKMDKE